MMLTIGELAERTGVSRRMLRHWESLGLLTPAETDPWTRHRRYSPHQSGRVRAIAALREVGFSLGSIADLVGDGLSQQRLIELLEGRGRDLQREIADALTGLAKVNERLATLRKGHAHMNDTLELIHLEELHLRGARRVVTDESDIGAAVVELLAVFQPQASQIDAEITLAYDGVSDPESIAVSVGVADSTPLPAGSEAKLFTLAGTANGVSVRCSQAPPSTADAWIALDAALEERGLMASGIHRQLLHPDGSVTLQAPVVRRLRE